MSNKAFNYLKQKDKNSQQPISKNSAEQNVSQSQKQDDSQHKTDTLSQVHQPQEKPTEVYGINDIQLTQDEQKVLDNLLKSKKDIANFINRMNEENSVLGKPLFIDPKPLGNANDYEPKSPLQDEFFPNQVKVSSASRELNPDSAEYQAEVLGPLVSRFDKKTPIPQITPKQVERILPIPEQPPVVENQDSQEEIKEETQNYAADDIYSLLPPSKAVNNISADPKDICPVDLEMDETGNPSPFFNLDKTFQNMGHPEWSASFSIPPQKFESNFWKNIAIKQYDSWLKYKDLPIEKKNSLAARNKKLKLIVPIASVLLIISTLFFTLLPKVTLNNGLSAIESGNFQEAVDITCNKTSNEYYCAYARVMLLTEEKKFEDALELVHKLQPYQQNVKYDLEEAESYVLYNQGLNLISEKKYAQGLNILKTIPNYKDVADVYYETCYRVAKEYETTNKEIALRYYYMANEYQDSKTKFEEISSAIYYQGLSDYYSNSFDQAREKFHSLKSFNYKDSNLLYTQSTYREALNALLAEDYQRSNELFQSILWFKDSTSLLIPEEKVQRPLTDREIAALIEKMQAEHPNWIKLYNKTADTIRFELYNGEIFNYNRAEFTDLQIEQFVMGHGAEEAISISKQTRNYFDEESPEEVAPIVEEQPTAESEEIVEGSTGETTEEEVTENSESEGE